MNATDNGREARSRAARRLRKLTIGTAALGVAATGGFGWLAAVTYSGATTSVTTAAITMPAATSAATGATSSTTSGTTTAAVPSVTAAQGIAHASTGGS
jgi:hypothetical protein